MSVIFGLDFGTTNSALSLNNDGKVTMLDIDPCNSSGITLKSVVYYDYEERRFFIGQDAVDKYIENDAFGRYLQSLKAFLPHQNFSKTDIDFKLYSIDDLVSLILLKAKQEGEKLINKEVENVVLGRPVSFSGNAKEDKLAEERLLSAARIAGFKNIFFQFEPIAAAFDYERELKRNEEKIVLVGDFGGGTSDFTVIKLRGGLKKIEVDRKGDVLSLGGVSIGGDTFDSNIMWEKVARFFGKGLKVKAIMGAFFQDMPPLIMDKIKQWHQIPFLRNPDVETTLKQICSRVERKDLINNLRNLIENNYGYMLFRAIEDAKCDLSISKQSEILFREDDLIVRENITRFEFEKEIIIDEYARIADSLHRVNKDAGLSEDDIDIVCLTGGSSHIPCIIDVFKNTYGPEKIRHTDAFTSVAYGLGLYGSRFL